MKTLCLCLFSISLSALCISVQSANIIYIGWPLFSHLNSMIYMASELEKLGHNNYITTPDEIKNKFDTRKGIHFLPMKSDPEVVEFFEIMVALFKKPPEANWNMLQSSMHKFCDNLLLDENWFQSLKSVNATLAVVDGVFIGNCLAISAYKLSIPFIFIGSHNQQNIHRTPWLGPVFPNLLTELLSSEHMTFIERCINTLVTLVGYITPPLGSPSKSVKTYAPNRPEISFDTLLRKAQLFLIEGDVLLDCPLPALPNVKYVGGMTTHPALPLEGDLAKFVNASKNGIIVLSFGSILSSLSKELLLKMEEVFKRIKYDVVWKRNESSYSQPNVYTTNWLPQNDLLGHPKTKLFISHCGNGGQFEALYHGVPMLGLPIAGDETANGHRMQVKGYGISMDINDLTADNLLRNIKEIIENPKYKNKIKTASDIFRSRPEHPARRAARHVDHIIKYGGDYMRSYCQDMPLYQYLMLDIYALLISVTIIGIIIVFVITRKCISICHRKKDKID